VRPSRATGQLLDYQRTHRSPVWAVRLIFRPAETQPKRVRARLARVRARLVVAAALVAAFLLPGAAAASLSSALAHALRVPHVSLASTGAVVLDLDTGATIYSRNANLSLLPASNEKLAVT